MQDAKWGYRKLSSQAYPILGPAVAQSPNAAIFELKNFEQTGVISRMKIRVFGNIVVAGAGPGVATGRENPESIMIQTTLKTTPDLGINVINNVSARGFMYQALFERGYLIKAPAVPDLAGTYAVDFNYHVNFRNPLAIKPVEFSLPMALFSSVQLTVQFGAREQLFAGGTNTWDLSGLQIQVWADLEKGIAGTFHMTSFDERTFPAIVAAQTDFQLQNIPAGYVYDSMLLRSEFSAAPFALTNALLNNWTVKGGGREWMPQGDLNAPMIQALNRDLNLTDPNAVQTGLYFLNAMRDGYITNALDSLDSMLDIKADVNLLAPITGELILVSKRSIPNALNLQGVVAAGATATTGAPVGAAAPAGT